MEYPIDLRIIALLVIDHIGDLVDLFEMRAQCRPLLCRELAANLACKLALGCPIEKGFIGPSLTSSHLG